MASSEDSTIAACRVRASVNSLGIEVHHPVQEAKNAPTNSVDQTTGQTLSRRSRLRLAFAIAFVALPRTGRALRIAFHVLRKGTAHIVAFLELALFPSADIT